MGRPKLRYYNSGRVKTNFDNPYAVLEGSGHKFEGTKVRINKDFLLFR